jgi:plastocyanin
MQLTHLPAALLALLPLAQAQYGYGSGSGSSSSSASASGAAASSIAGIHVVKVGDGGQTMDPADLSVPAGQVIEFHFYQGAHSVAQSAFVSPCTPLNGTTGFFSGSQPVSSGVGTNVFSVVSTGQPMWYYCATGRHCQNGMVGVINKPYVTSSFPLHERCCIDSALERTDPRPSTSTRPQRRRRPRMCLHPASTAAPSAPPQPRPRQAPTAPTPSLMPAWEWPVAFS